MSLLRSLALPLTLTLTLIACDDSPTDLTAPASASIEASPTPTAASPEERYASALELAAAGRIVDARAAVGQALVAGAGRDAKLLAAQLAILDGDLGAAADLLRPLASDAPPDALVRYNLGLVAQRRGEYNRARGEYLAALRADPTLLAARHNLAVLAWDAGMNAEASHHAAKFLDSAPNHPRSAGLRAQLASGGRSPRDTSSSSRVSSNSFARTGLVK